MHVDWSEACPDIYKHWMMMATSVEETVQLT